MADELASSPSEVPGVGLRHEADRRHSARRAYTRETRDRRRGERRRQRLRSLLFTSLALIAPQQLRQSIQLSSVPAGARVSTTIDSVFAIPPKEAYEGIIREAS